MTEVSQDFSLGFSWFFFFHLPPHRISVCHLHIFLIPQRVDSPEFQKELRHPEGRSKDCRALESREDSSRPALDLKRHLTLLTSLGVEDGRASLPLPLSSSTVLPSAWTHLLKPVQNVAFPPCPSHYNSSVSSFPGGENAECSSFALPGPAAWLCFCGATLTSWIELSRIEAPWLDTGGISASFSRFGFPVISN